MVLDFHRQGWIREGRPVVVDGHGVMRIVGVAGDIAHDGELAGGGGEGVFGYEGGDFLGEVDAVDEDVGFDDFFEGAAAFCLCRKAYQQYSLRDRDIACYSGLEKREKGATHLLHIPLYYLA